MALSTEAASALTTVQGLDETEKKKVVDEVQRANPDLFPRGDWQRTILWLTLLILLAAVAMTGAILGYRLSQDDKDATAYVALASAFIGGVIGLFAKSPVA